jgi:hypothetical protein
MKTVLSIAFLCFTSLPAFAIQSQIGWCEQGGQRVTLANNGQQSSGYFQRSFPSCTVTVFLAGTNTAATIYSNSSMTPKSNPFTASTTGLWFFYAADGNYDVQYSGGGLSVPFKITNLQLITSGGGGGGGTVTTTGSPSSGNLTCFSGATSITNCNLSGDGTTSGAGVFTLATVNSNTGTCGDSTHVCQVTLNAKGLATAATPVSISGSGGSPAFSAITSGSNTTAAMTVGSGATLSYSGTGVVDANKILGTTLTGLTGIAKLTAGVPSIATCGTDVVCRTTATTYTAGAKQTVSQSVTTAGLNLGILSIDPSIPAQGDLWYNNGAVKFRDSGATNTLLFSAPGPPSIIFAGATSGSTTLQAQAIAAGTTSLPKITGSLPVAYFCGATTGAASCANTDTAGTGRVFSGIATLASNSAVISAISPAFTSTATFACVANDLTTRANPVQVANTSASSITITNTTGASDVINYVCVGY